MLYKTVVRIEPGLSYLYLPNVIYNDFAAAINSIFPKTCSFKLNICRFEKACKDVKDQFVEKTDFKLRLTDIMQDYELKIRSEALLVDGKWWGDSSRCWIPIF